MTYSADFLIERRKAKWKELKSIDYDKKLRRAIAGQIITSEQLLAEIKKNPEKLIELEFVVVDKEQRTTPFFFNEVQRDFIERLNAAIKDFEEGLIQDISILILIISSFISKISMSSCILFNGMLSYLSHLLNVSRFMFSFLLMDVFVSPLENIIIFNLCISALIFLLLLI